MLEQPSWRFRRPAARFWTRTRCVRCSPVQLPQRSEDCRTVSSCYQAQDTLQDCSILGPKISRQRTLATIKNNRSWHFRGQWAAGWPGTAHPYRSNSKSNCDEHDAWPVSGSLRTPCPDKPHTNKLWWSKHQKSAMSLYADTESHRTAITGVSIR